MVGDQAIVPLGHVRDRLAMGGSEGRMRKPRVARPHGARPLDLFDCDVSPSKLRGVVTVKQCAGAACTPGRGLHATARGRSVAFWGRR
jgi:hypothetical protein